MPPKALVGKRRFVVGLGETNGVLAEQSIVVDMLEGCAPHDGPIKGCIPCVSFSENAKVVTPTDYFFSLLGFLVLMKQPVATRENFWVS